MKKKRLLFISNLFPNPTEPQRATFNRQQIQALAAYGDIDVIAPVAWQSRWLRRDKLYPFESKHGKIRVLHPTYWYTPGLGRLFYGYYFYLSIKQAVKFLAQTNTYDVVMGAWLFPDGYAAAKVASQLNIPLYIKVHGTDVNQLKKHEKLTNMALAVTEQAVHVFCVSGALRNRLIELGCSKDKLLLLYNGVDTAIFSPQEQHHARQQLSIPESATIILYVGNLKESKGLHELSIAFDKIARKRDIADLYMVIVGTGPFEKTLRNLLRSYLPTNRIRFTGVLGLPEVALWMNAANVLCLPSYMEGLPNVVLEALACGTPVVASAVGGIPELAGQVEGLTLIEARNVSSLVNGLRMVISSRSSSLAAKGKCINSWDDNAKFIAKSMNLV